MIIICGKTIAEVEHNLEMVKMAIASGANVGVGGATIADVEKALEMGVAMMGGAVPNTPPCCGCNCSCGECEDEVETDYTEEEDDGYEPPIYEVLNSLAQRLEDEGAMTPLMQAMLGAVAEMVE